MPQPMGFHVRLGWSGWLTLLIALGLVLTVAAVVAIVLLGVFIILLPIVLVGALLYYLFPGLRRHQGRWSEPDIIEGQYRVVDLEQIERDPPPDDRT
jgi:hypothetical protein